MKLHIAPLSGSVFTVEAQPTWILQDLLVEVEAVRGPATLRKFFLQPGAVQLLDNKILQDCVEDGSELLVVDSSPTLVLATCSQTALLWHVDAFEPAQHFEGHTGEVTFACFSKDGKKFATTSNDGSARVWDVCLGSEIHVLVHPRVEMVRRKKPKMPPKERAAPEVKYLIPEVMHADFSPEGTKLVTTSNFDVWLWDIISGTGIHPFPRTNTFRTNFVTFSPDGSKVAGANPRTAYIWDTATGAHVQIFEADGLSCFRFLDDDRALGVTNSNDTGAGALWSVSTGELLHRFPCRDGMILSHIAPVPVPSSPGHLHVASVDHTGSVHVWDSLSGELLRSMEREPAGPLGTDQIFTPAISQDGRLAIVPTKNGPANLWDIQTGEKLHVLEMPPVINSSEDWGAAFTPDSKKVAILHNDAEPGVRLWDCETGQMLADWRAECVNSLAVAGPTGS